MKTIYSQTNCPACVALKKQYQETGVEFVEVIIGKDVTVADFRAAYPDVRSVPFVVGNK